MCCKHLQSLVPFISNCSFLKACGNLRQRSSQLSRLNDEGAGQPGLPVEPGAERSCVRHPSGHFQAAPQCLLCHRGFEMLVLSHFKIKAKIKGAFLF